MVYNKEEISAIKLFREEFIFCSHDTTNMTDEEVLEGVKCVAKTIGRFGATEKEAAIVISVLKK